MNLGEDKSEVLSFEIRSIVVQINLQFISHDDKYTASFIDS